MPSPKILFSCLLLTIGFIFPHTSWAASDEEVIIKDANQTIISTFKPFPEANFHINQVSIADLGRDGVSEVIVSATAGSQPLIRTFRQDGSQIQEFLAYSELFMGGVNLAVCDLNNDGISEIITGAGPGGGPHVRVFRGDGALIKHFFTFPESQRLGVKVNCYQETTTSEWHIVATENNGENSVSKLFTKDGQFIKDLLTNPGIQSPLPKDGVTASISILRKSVIVDISEQRLYAYENDQVVKSFLVSTARPGYRTPTGLTTILAKIPSMTYAWSYGLNNPNNYSLPGVKWNMRIFPHIYIHSAYWHNNFGHPMSHGCINTSIPDAEWLYNWSNVGTAVEVKI